jgi:hypothetical protein
MRNECRQKRLLIGKAIFKVGTGWKAVTEYGAPWVNTGPAAPQSAHIITTQ